MSLCPFSLSSAVESRTGWCLTWGPWTTSHYRPEERPGCRHIKNWVCIFFFFFNQEHYVNLLCKEPKIKQRVVNYCLRGVLVGCLTWLVPKVGCRGSSCVVERLYHFKFYFPTGVTWWSGCVHIHLSPSLFFGIFVLFRLFGAVLVFWCPYLVPATQWVSQWVSLVLYLDPACILRNQHVTYFSNLSSNSNIFFYPVYFSRYYCDIQLPF